MQELLNRDDVFSVIGDMCQFGMSQQVDGEDKLVKKPTGFMTKCWGIAKRLSKRCNNDHEHIRLEGGRTKQAQVYLLYVVIYH